MTANNNVVSFIVLLLLFQFSVSSQAEAVSNSIKAPLASKSLLLDAVSKDDKIIVVGERGHILLSEDGKNWQQANVPTQSTLTAVYFHNKYLGWAVGHDAIILRTVDGGKNWDRVYYSPDDEAPLLDVWFKDEDRGIAIGAYGLYLVTEDGGKTWTREDFTVTNSKTLDIQESDIDDMDADNFVESYDLHLNSITQSKSGKLYIAAEAGRIYRSDDNGHSWLQLASPYAGSFFGIQSITENNLLVFGLRGNMYRSENDGESWTQIKTNTTEMLTNSLRLQDGTILVVGLGGMLIISKDDGYSFSTVELGTRSGYAAIIRSSNGKLLAIGENGTTPIDHVGKLDLDISN